MYHSLYLRHEIDYSVTEELVFNYVKHCTNPRVYKYCLNE